MKINITQKNSDIEDDELNIIIESKNNNSITDEVIEYLKEFNKKKNKKVTVYDKDIVKAIECKDIILFYSKDKNNYCKTKDNTYKIKSKLYEIEDFYEGFFRISKKCVINVDHIDEFDMSTKGKIVARFDDGTEEPVSRRKVREVSKFMKERRI